MILNLRASTGAGHVVLRVDLVQLWFDVGDSGRCHCQRMVQTYCGEEAPSLDRVVWASLV